MHDQRPLEAIPLRLLVLLWGLPCAFPTYPNISSIPSSERIPIKSDLARKLNLAPVYDGQLEAFQASFLPDSAGPYSNTSRLESPRTENLINLDQLPGFQQPDLYRQTTNQSLLTQRRRTNENLVQPWNSNGAMTLVTWTEYPTNQKHAWSNPNKTPHEHRGTQLRHER